MTLALPRLRRPVFATPHGPRRAALAAALPCLLGLASCGGGDDGEVRHHAKLDRAVAALHAGLQQEIGRSVPSLSVMVQTPAHTYFATATASGAVQMTPDTRIRFASNTKNFTAAAVMKMHQDGWLDYRDLVTAKIPGSDTRYLPDTADWALPYKDRITIRELLQHSAGVFDIGNDPVPDADCAQTYEDCVLAEEPDHDFTLDEIAAQAAANQLSYFEPGTGFHYSNTGYTTLAEIVGRVYSQRSGRPRSWSDYVQDHLVGPDTPQPLDVHFPDQGDDQTLPTPRECGHVVLPDQSLEICDANVSAKVAEGNGIGTMRLLNRWVRSVHSGQNVLSPATVKLMHDDVSAANPTYALGTFRTENLGYGHNGATLGNLSQMMYDPETQISVVVYVPMWDLREGSTSFLKVFDMLNCTGWVAREALGYAGRPASANCPVD